MSGALIPAFVAAALAGGESRVAPVQQPPGARPATVSMEDLARQGYEVKSMVQAAARAGQYIVLMQRAGDVRTCLLRVSITDATQVPTRQSACF